MPAWMASAGEVKVTGWPLMMIVPDVGGNMP